MFDHQRVVPDNNNTKNGLPLLLITANMDFCMLPINTNNSYLYSYLSIVSYYLLLIIENKAYFS